MNEAPDRTARNRFLLTNLAVLIIFILAMVVIISAYPLVFAPPPTGTVTDWPTRTITPTITDSPTITPSPTATRTLRPTFTPTITLTPSRTASPTVTPSPMGPPTLTPARPVIGEGIYFLNKWGPEQADYMAAMMEDYPNTLTGQERGIDNANYYAAFDYAAFAHQEALLRYPDAIEADDWRWRFSYDLARLSDPEAGALYAGLITEALNQDLTELESLPDWFHTKEPHIELIITSISPRPGSLSTYLLQLKGSGSAFIILNESSGAYNSEVLLSQFDFVNQPDLSAFGSDLTGDGLDEVIIYILQPVENFDLVPPYVYDFNDDAAIELPFNPIDADFPIGGNYTASWSGVSSSLEIKDLQFTTRVLPACSVNLSRTYRWNGERFDLLEMLYQADPSPSTLAYCEHTIDHASSTWGPGPTIDIMEAILPDWPPQTDVNGNPYPDDGLDEWRYRLGVNHALIGEQDEATAYFDLIITSPASTTSQWIEPAKEFLAVYEKPTDVYSACLGAQFCNPQDALIYLVESLPAEEYDSLLTYLWDSGVSLRSSGYFDFDGDDSRELWFIVRHRSGEQLELWTAAAYPTDIKPFFLQYIDANVPAFEYYDDEQVPPVVLVNGNQIIRMERLADTLEPYLVYPELPKFYPNLFEESLQDLTERLFSGEDPVQIHEELLYLEEYPGLLCAPYWACDPYYYLLGLSAELAGEDDIAIHYYLHLWWNYSKSPFTTMARLKLKGVGLPATSTTTITITPTSTQTLMPTVTGTPPTATPSPTMTTTPEGSTPYPAPQPTATPYNPYPS